MGYNAGMSRSTGVVIALGCALASGYGVACGKPSDGSATRLAHAQQLMQEGDFPGARTILRELLSSGDDGTAQRLLAESYDLSGDHSQAVQAYASLTEVRPTDAVAWTHLGRSLALAGRSAEALEKLAKARTLDARLTQPLLLQAALESEPDALAKIAKQLDRLPPPASGERLLVRAEIAEVTGDTQAAEDALTALDGAPLASIRGASALAELYRRRQRLQAVERLLEQLVAAGSDPAARALELAEVALQQNHVDVARKALTKVPTGASAPARASVARARVARAAGHLEEARAGLSQAIPKLAGAARDAARFQLAEVLLALGDNAAVEGELRELLDADVGFAAAAMMLADLLENTGRADEVPSTLSPLVKRHPEAAPLYARLGQAQLRLGQGQAARDTFATLVEQTPNDPRSHYLLGTALRTLSDNDRAREAFHASLRLLPGQPAPLAALVALAVADRQSDRAQELLTTQIKAQPRNPTLYRMLSDFHRARGEHALAEKALHRATAAAPDDENSWFQLGEYLSARGEAEEAQAAFEKGLEIDPDNAYGWNRVGDLAYVQREGDTARRAFERALSLAPQLPRAQANVARVLADDGTELARAERLAKAAQQADPKQPEVLATLGWIHHLRGASEQALPLLEATAETYDTPTNLYRLGAAYRAAGKLDAAKKTLKRALDMADDFPGAAQAKAALSDLP